jgi:opacity protein-like surface antigen
VGVREVYEAEVRETGRGHAASVANSCGIAASCGSLGANASMLRTLILLSVALLSVASASHAEDTDDLRGYLGVRLGISAAYDTEIGGGLSATPNEQVLGVSVGLNLGRHLGLELAGDGWERNMRFERRTIGEFAMYTGMPLLRARYPLLEGRLTPYALAGLGVGYTEFNDRKRPGFELDIGGSSWGVVGALGLGLEYFVANNIAIGIETKYIISRGQEIRVNGRQQSLDLDTLLATAGLRLFFPEVKRR